MNFASSKLKYSLFALVVLLMLPAFPHVAADSGNGQNNLKSATIPTGIGPAAIDVLPSLGKVFVANFGAGCSLSGICSDYGSTVTVISTMTNTVIDNVNVEAGPFSVASDQLRNKVYVADYPSGDIQVINGRTDAVTLCASPGPGTDSVAINPFTNVLYATNIAGYLFAIDASTCTIIGSATTGTGPIGSAIDPLTNTVYVTNLYDGTVSIFNAKSLALKQTVSVGIAPTGIAVDPVLGKVYVANSGFWNTSSPSNSVTVISARTNEVIAAVQVGQGPAGVAVNDLTHQVYVCNFGAFTAPGNTVSVINGGSLKVTTTLTAGTGPSEVITDSHNSGIYVMNFFDNTVTAFTPSGNGQNDQGNQNGNDN